MTADDKLRDALVRLVNKPSTNIIAKVTKVDGKTCDVKPIDGSADILGVRLSPIVDESDEGYFLEPVIDSDVIVSIIKINAQENVSYVSRFSRIAKVKFMMAGGDEYTVPKAEVIIEEYTKTKVLLEALLAVIKGAPIPEPGSGANSALQAALAGAVAAFELGDFEDIGNENFIHA